MILLMVNYSFSNLEKKKKKRKERKVSEIVIERGIFFRILTRSLVPIIIVYLYEFHFRYFFFFFFFVSFFSRLSKIHRLYLNENININIFFFNCFYLSNYLSI